MPVGIQRINAKTSQPNERVVFIKPLKGPDEATARDFLERIAAQCLPIMKEHLLSVMTLEEYEPNREFVGRNFNAGEVVQLVLKSPSTGRWLPFHYVQMVMMHELAHCKQMNHSRAFWAVRNRYAEELRALWSRGYTGDGLWGRGALLATGEFERDTAAPGEALPEHLCGGTYRTRRRRKRKAGAAELTYRERKERRILRKFGADGQKLGADDAAKVRLEKGRKIKAAPRVAGSARGRELRAAAALARFGQQKKEEEEDGVEAKDEDEDETASEADYETDGEDAGAAEAVDLDGRKLLDGKGHGMIRVCEDEDPAGQDAQQELRELQSSLGRRPAIKAEEDAGDEPGRAGRASLQKRPDAKRAGRAADLRKPAEDVGMGGGKTASREPSRAHPLPLPAISAASATGRPGTRACPVCSFENEGLTVTCNMCLHVLDPESVRGSWKCQAASCKGSPFVNAGDCGVCGVCGQRKSSG